MSCALSDVEAVAAAPGSVEEVNVVCVPDTDEEVGGFEPVDGNIFRNVS